MRKNQLGVLVFLAIVAGCSGDSDYLVELSTPEETPLPLPLIPTHPPDGTPAYTVTTEPQHGTLEGTFPTAVYRPEADYNGDDSIVVEVEDGAGTVDVTLTINVTPANDAPTPNTDVVEGTEDTTQTIQGSTLVENDQDVDGDALAITGVRSVRNGSATVEGGNIVFTPAANFVGSATLVYSVSDGQTSAPGALIIYVGGVDDAPIAVDDYLYTDEDVALTFDPTWLTGNDIEVEDQTLTLIEVSNAQNGTVTLANGAITFTPDAAFIGDATFNYTVSDGALTATGLCTVTVAAPPPPSSTVNEAFVSWR